MHRPWRPTGEDSRCHPPDVAATIRRASQRRWPGRIGPGRVGRGRIRRGRSRRSLPPGGAGGSSLADAVGAVDAHPPRCLDDAGTCHVRLRERGDVDAAEWRPRRMVLRHHTRRAPSVADGVVRPDRRCVAGGARLASAEAESAGGVVGCVLRGHLARPGAGAVLVADGRRLLPGLDRRDPGGRPRHPDPWHAEHGHVHADGSTPSARLVVQPVELVPAVDLDRPRVRRPRRVPLPRCLSTRVHRDRCGIRSSASSPARCRC